MIEGKVIEGEFAESWDKKRIAIGIVVFVLLIAGFFGFKSMVLDKNEPQKTFTMHPSQSVAGASTQNITESSGSVSSENMVTPPQINVQAGVAQKLQDIKDEINSVNISSAAASSPQMQKLMGDIKSLEGLPGSQAKQFCEQICRGL